jgi:hypothetical protein
VVPAILSAAMGGAAAGMRLQQQSEVLSALRAHAQNLSTRGDGDRPGALAVAAAAAPAALARQVTAGASQWSYSYPRQCEK